MSLQEWALGLCYPAHMSRSGLTIVIVDALMRRANAKARKRPEGVERGDGRILRYQAGMFLVIGGLGFIFFGAMALLTWFFEEDPGLRTFHTCGLAFGSLMCLLLINEGRAVVWLDAEGIGAKSPWRWWSVELAWGEVEELRWGGQALMWYRIKGPGGTIRVHQWHGGRILEDYFARFLSEEIAREAIAEANLIERHKWRAFWRERVQEAAELFGGTR